VKTVYGNIIVGLPSLATSSQKLGPTVISTYTVSNL